MKDKQVVVLMGGPSTEAEISRNTGRAICEALQSIGYNAKTVEYRPQHVIEDLKKRFRALECGCGNSFKSQCICIAICLRAFYLGA